MSEFAEDKLTAADREWIDAFLRRVLPEEEREFIESYFISDEANILDCSLADIETLKANCFKAHGVSLSTDALRMPLHVLVPHVKALRP